MKTPWVFVDCEARGISPVHGTLTEFGAVHYDTRDTFYGRLFEATPDPENPAISIVGERLATDEEVAGSFAAWLREHLGGTRPVFVSDNPAYDWQWISGMFDRAGMDNPFGHSGRRISDFWAGLNRNWSEIMRLANGS
jgi:DNA polymerase III epsilon subunit-like protein